MSNKVLIIPDVHERDFWKEPCYNWDGVIIFLGNYVDPYPPITKEQALSNVQELVKFKENTKCTCKFILGNHCYSYFTGFAKCRYDTKNADLIKDLLTKLDLVLCTTIKADNETYLFSHAGITPQWINSKDYLDREFTVPNAFLDIMPMLEQVPYSRGGRAEYGSCIWNSLEDFALEYLSNGNPLNVYQIFGHTYRVEPFITNDYAMLDCAKAFVLDLTAHTITEWKNKNN